MNGDNNWDGAGTGHSSDGDSSGRDGGLSDLLYRGRLDVMDPLSAAYKQAPEYLTDEAEDRTFEKMSYRIGIAYLAGVCVCVCGWCCLLLFGAVCFFLVIISCLLPGALYCGVE